MSTLAAASTALFIDLLNESLSVTSRNNTSGALNYNTSGTLNYNTSGTLNYNTSGNLIYTMVMEDKSINTLCDGTSQNTSMCNKKALGISLSTPILMNTAGILGNVVALIVLCTARKEMKKTMFYVLLCGLAGTDLLGQLLTGPIAIIVYANNLHWVGGDPLCKYHGFFMVCFGIITPLLVCCLSIERVIGLRFPYYHERSLTKRKVVSGILACWVFVLLFCCLPFLGVGSYAHQFPGSWCFLNFHRESTSDEVYAYMYAFINVFIITVIIIGNTCVMVTLVQMKKRKLSHSPSTERRDGNHRKSKLKLEEETQMIWFLFAITIVFTICWFPLNIHILINQVTGRINYPADLMGIRLASINVILDPWLYILLRKSVIVKAFKFIKNVCLQKQKFSPKRDSRYITNYSQTNIPRGTRHNSVNIDGHELRAIPQTCTQVNEVDICSDCLDTSSSSGMESDAEIEQRYLKQTRTCQRLSDSSVAYRKNIHDSCNGSTMCQNRISTYGNRKSSLPARIPTE